MSTFLDVIPYALPLVGVWLGARMTQAAQARLADRRETTERAERRREEMRTAYAEFLAAANHQLTTTLRWHIARTDGAEDAPTVEREMYQAMGAQRAARATVEIVGSEAVRDAAAQLAEGLVEGMHDKAEASFLERARRDQWIVMECMREDLGTETSLRRKVGTNPPAPPSEAKRPVGAWGRLRGR